MDLHKFANVGQQPVILKKMKQNGISKYNFKILMLTNLFNFFNSRLCKSINNVQMNQFRTNLKSSGYQPIYGFVIQCFDFQGSQILWLANGGKESSNIPKTIKLLGITEYVFIFRPIIMAFDAQIFHRNQRLILTYFLKFFGSQCNSTSDVVIPQIIEDFHQNLDWQILQCLLHDEFDFFFTWFKIEILNGL